MDAALPAGEVVMLAAALLLGGAITGVLSGLFGVGGGGVIVPVLYELFGILGAPDAVRMHLAVGTSFAVIVPTSLRAARSHYHRGAIDAQALRVMGAGAILGVALGAITAKFADEAAMKLVWVVSAALLSTSLVVKPQNWRLPGDPANPLVGAPLGVGVGFLATMMGVGGGAYVTPAMTLLGRPIHQAVGTAAGFGVVVAIPALLGYMWAGWGAEGLPPGSLGFISLIGAAAMIPASVLTAPLGVRLAHGLPRRTLELAFAAFLSLVGLRFLFALLV